MQEFATRLEERALVLAGCGYPDAQAMPYQPIVEAMRPALGIQPLSANLQPAWLAEASRLMPELRDLYPSLPDPLPAEPEQARARLLEALCQLTLGLAAGPRPVLLCLDDLHWADGTTLDWLAHLARKLHGSRLLVLGTYRSGEASAMSGLRHGLARQGILSDLRLGRLDEGAIVQVLVHIGRAAASDEALARRLHRVTGGNPFFLLETLRALLESDLETSGRQALEEWADRPAADLPDGSGQALPLATTIQAAVDARVERLSAKARQVLEAAALGEVDLAQECLLESLSIARQIADRTQEILCLGHLGWLCVALKLPARALEHLKSGLALAEGIGSCAEQAWLLSGLAEAHRLAGDPSTGSGQAVPYARRALDAAQATGRPHDERLALRVLDRLEGG